MSNRPLAERDRYSLARELGTRSFSLWQFARLAAAVSITAFILLEPEHRLARALLQAATAFFHVIAQ